eukprot:668365-Prymnesium_polylepis.1
MRRVRRRGPGLCDCDRCVPAAQCACFIRLYAGHRSNRGRGYVRFYPACVRCDSGLDFTGSVPSSQQERP